MRDILRDILVEIKQQVGVDLSGYRRGTLQSVLNARLQELRCDDPSVYADGLRHDPAECDFLLSAFSINVSRFFRNPAMYEVLAERVLPNIMERKRGNRNRELRVWSVGCAEGEEPYSVAIVIHQALKAEPEPWTTHIFATDIDAGALARASKAHYSRERLLDTKLGILDTYFEVQGNGFSLRPMVRDMVHFSRENIASEKTQAPSESIFGTFDLILCRNVLIYFEQELQRTVLRKLTEVLDHSGFLILGESESLDSQANSMLENIDASNRIFCKPPRRAQRRGK